MRKNRLLLLFVMLFSLLSSFINAQECDSTAEPRIWVSREVLEDTIYYEGAPSNYVSVDTVVFKAWASGCSSEVVTGSKYDVYFLLDRSYSMMKINDGDWEDIINTAEICADSGGGWNSPHCLINRSAGDRDSIEPISRIQGAYNAMSSLIQNNFMSGDMRLAFMYLNNSGSPSSCGSENIKILNPITHIDDDPGWANFLTSIDNNTKSFGCGGSNIWTGLDSTLSYVLENKRDGASPAIIILSDASDNVSESYKQSVLDRIDSIKNEMINFKIFTILIGGGNDYDMQRIASAAGNDSNYVFSETGADVDSLLAMVAEDLTVNIVAYNLDQSDPTNNPMFTDVLGEDIHLHNNWYQVNSGSGFIAPQIEIDTVDNYTRIRMGVDTVWIGDSIEVRYAITAAMDDPTGGKIMNTNNAPGDHPTYYSKVQYKSKDGDTLEYNISKKNIYVKNAVSGIKLSTTPAPTYTIPSPTKTISLQYGNFTAAEYDDVLYALREESATGISQYSLVSAVWNFDPTLDWDGTVLNNESGSSKSINFTVEKPNAGTEYLTLSYSYDGRNFNDTLTFIASDSSTPESVISVNIDDDTTSDGNIGTRYEVIGDSTYLNNYTKNLFARSISSWGNNSSCNATWSIAEPFNLFNVSNISGSGSQKTFGISYTPSVTNQKIDSGRIQIDTGGLFYNFYLVINDTTNYDTTDALLIYDNDYNYNETNIENAYAAQKNTKTYNPNAGDSLTFYSMVFDSNGIDIKYLGSPSVNWYLNGSLIKNGNTYGIKKTTPGANDQLVVSYYVSLLNKTKRDTVNINWDYGTERIMSLESSPGIIGDSTSNPISLLDTIVILNTQTDTVRNVYSVIRDEFGYCLSDGNGAYVSWSKEGPASDNVEIPTSANNEGWVYKTSNPSSSEYFHLIADGLSSGGIGGDKDSAVFKLVSYAYDRLEIYASSQIQGISANDSIPYGTIIELEACALSGEFHARLFHDDTLWDTRSDVVWNVMNGTNVSSSFPNTSAGIDLSTTDTITIDTLVAYYAKSAGDTLWDTLLFSSKSPYITSVYIDSSSTGGGNTNELYFEGDTSYLRSITFNLYSLGQNNCGVSGNSQEAIWSSSGASASWFTSIFTGTKNSVELDLSEMPQTSGDKSINNATIRIDDPDGFNDIINITIKDTTDYDTIQFVIIDTTDYDNSRDAINGSELFAKKSDMLEFTKPAGDTITLYSLLFDLNKSGAALLGNDFAEWNIKYSNGTQVDTVCKTFKYSNITAGATDTIIVSYPSSQSTFDQDMPAPPPSHRIIVTWEAGDERFIYLTQGGAIISGDTLEMTLNVDTTKVFPVVKDEFDNVIGTPSVTRANWYIDDDSYLSVPTELTNEGLIVKDSLPPSNIIRRIVAQIPVTPQLGNANTLSDTVYVSIDNSINDSIVIVNATADGLYDTDSTLLDSGEVITYSDVILLRACNDTANFIAKVHSTDTTKGDNGWIYATDIIWTYNGDTLSSPEIARQIPSGLDSLTAYEENYGLSATVHFEIKEPYYNNFRISPSSYTITDDSSGISQSIEFASFGLTECGGIYDSVSSVWDIYGFNDTTIYTPLLTGKQKWQHLQFSFDYDTLCKSDSGFVVASFYDSLRSGNRFYDTVKIVINDTTDYDTVDVSIIVTDSAYNHAAYSGDYNSLYGLQNYSVSNIKCGDTLKLRNLLFDVNQDQEKYLGSGFVSYNSAKTFWKINSGSWSSSNEIFKYYNETPKKDTIVARYGLTPDNFVLTDTIYINWSVGSDRILSIESRPGSLTDDPSYITDEFIFGTSKYKDTLYAVIRDNYENFVSNSGLVKWSVVENNYVEYMNVPNIATLKSNCEIIKTANPSSEQSFTFVARLESGQIIEEEYTSGVQYDSVTVVFTNYNFIELRAFAGESISDTSNNNYLSGDSIPSLAVLNLTALEDTITIDAKVLRDTDGNWYDANLTDWSLSNYDCVNSTSFSQSKSIEILPYSVCTLDSIFLSYDAGSGNVLYDTVLFTIDDAWIDSFYIHYDTSSIAAGDTFDFEIIGFNKNGDTVYNSDRLPDGFNINANIPFNFININDTQFVESGSYFVEDAFDNGTSQNSIITYISGENLIIIDIPYYVGSTQKNYKDTIYLNTVASSPDSIVVIHYNQVYPVDTTTLAVNDTLASYSPDPTKTQNTYKAYMYDMWENLVEDESLYNQLEWEGDQEIILENKMSFLGGNRIMQYNSADSNGDGGEGNVTVRFSDDVQYSFNIMVTPLVQIKYISTHEWCPDTSTEKGIDKIKYVLENVCKKNIDHLGLSGADSVKALYLSTLNDYGYSSYFDGYLDYIDLEFDRSFELKKEYISDISFDIVSKGNSLDTVNWQIRELICLDSSIYQNDTTYTRYRIWLIPNSLDSTEVSPLETGFYPVMTFNNEEIESENINIRFPVKIGDGQDLYKMEDSLCLDSASAVVADFLLQNNKCNPDNPENNIRIVFSEPIKYQANFPNYDQLICFTLINGIDKDSTFTSKALLSGGKVNSVYDDKLAWNYNNETDRMVTYSAVVNPDSNQIFRANISKIRFAVDSSISQIKDINGNNSNFAYNKPIMLRSDRSVPAYICDANGNTVVDRFSAVNLGWSYAEEQKLKPDFHYFGFTINMSAVNENNSQLTEISSFNIGTKSYVVMDYDTNLVFVATQATIFDLYGNMVASPKSHPTLKKEYGIKEVRNYMGLDDIEEGLVDGNSMDIDELNKHYNIIKASNLSSPDTLRPKYDQTFTVGYDYMREVCGPDSDVNICVPAWNCTNAKGRLVAPGGYVARQFIISGGKKSQIIKKLIVSGSGSDRKLGVQ